MMPVGPTPLLRLAGMQLAQGNPFQAIETLKQALTEDPDHAEAHALLALCLLGVRRIDAAAHETKLSLAADPLLPLAHYVQGSVLLGQRKLEEAERSFDTLLELEPDEPENHRAMARLLELKGERAEAEAWLKKALELNPEDPQTLTALGEARLAAGDVDQADRLADEALRLQPEHQDALVLRGTVALRRGDVKRAREHAVWALRLDAEDPGALHLITAIKSRTNWFLGLWWRYSSWIGSLGMGRAIVVLLGAFVLYRLATIWAAQAGRSDLARFIQFGWLGICVYTWVGPGLFARSLKRETDRVVLNQDF